MAENCSNVGTFTASLDKAFHIGIILGEKTELVAVNWCRNVYKMSDMSSCNKRIINHALRNVYTHQTVHKLEKDK